MGPKCGHLQSSVHSLDATEGMAAFWNGICAKCPTCQSCNCFSCHRSSTKRYIWNMRCEIWNMRARGSHAALHHHTGHWPGSSCCILAWHRFRGFCAKQTGLLRLPLRSRLREGIVWFMRWEEKIKLPRCLSSGMKRKKSSLMFGSSGVFTAHRFQREERKCGGWVLCFRQSPLPNLGDPQPSSPAKLEQGIHIPL